MTEDTTELGESNTPAPNPFEIIEHTKDEVSEAYARHGANTEAFLARFTATILNDMPQFQGKARYDELLQGTAPILDEIDLPLAPGQGMSNDQIISYFSTLKGLGEDGAPTKVNAFLSGLTRGTTSASTGVATAKLFAQAAPPYIPLPGPLAPLGVLSKPVMAASGFIAGSVLGDKFIGKPVAESVFGTLDSLDVVLTPRAEATFRAYESSGQVVPYVFLHPWMMPQAKLSTIHNLKKLPLANRVRSTITEEELANPLIQKYLSGKLNGFPTNREIEMLRNKIFKEAKDAGESITLKQANKRAAKELKRSNFFTRSLIGSVDYLEDALVKGGQLFTGLTTKGKAGVLAAEAAAVPATGFFVGETEKEFPRQEGPRLLAETSGAIVPNLMLLKYAPILIDKIGGVVTRLKETRALKQAGDTKASYFGDPLGIGRRANIRAIDDIYEVLNDNAEDPDELLKQLEKLIVDPVISDGKIISYKLKPEFEKLADQGQGKPKAAIFSSQFLDSVGIAQLEGTVLKRSGKEGPFSTQRDASFVKSMEMQRGIIFALRGTGDKQLVKLAGQIMQERIGLLIQSRLENAINATVNSVKKIYPEGGSKASKLLGERLKKVVENQETLFKRLEKSAWAKVPKKTKLNTFYRTDEKGERFQHNIPNFVEQWEEILKNSSDIEKKRILRVPEFADFDEFVKKTKSSLKLERSGQLSQTPNISSYRNKLDNILINMEGDEPFKRAFESYVDVSRRQFVGEDGTFLVVPDGVQLSQLRNNTVEGLNFRNPQGIREVLAPIDLQIRRLRQRAESIAANNIGENRNPRSTAMVNALNSQANLLAAQSGSRAKIIEVEDVLEGGPGVSSQELVGLYSTAGELAREFGTVKTNFARISNIMRAAALEDLNGLPDGRGAYDNARNISFAYQNFLRRTFAGDILQTNATGKPIVAPYLLSSKLITGKSDVVDLRLMEIEEVGHQIRKYSAENNYNIVSAEEVDDVMGTANEVLSDMLKLAIKEVELPIEARKGLSPQDIALRQDELLQSFVSKNQELIKKFPKLEQMIEEADNAGTFLRRAINTTDKLMERAKSQKAYTKLIGAENPERAVAAAFKSENPTEELQSLVTVLNTNIFKKSSPNRKQRQLKVLKELGYTKNYDIDEARKGLRTSIMNFAFSKGGRLSRDNFNAKSVYTTLFERVPNAKSDEFTLVKFMLDNNIITSKEASGLQQGLIRIIQTETKKNVQDAIVTNQTSFLSDLYTRILGAKVGTTIGGSLPGARGPGVGFIEAEAGSRFLRQLTQELPALQEMDALEKILFDPTLLALALRQPRSTAEKSGIFNAILRGLKTVIGAVPAPALLKGIPLGAQEFVEPEISSEPPTFETEPPLPQIESKAPAPLQIPAQRSALPTTDIASVSPSLNPVPTASGPVNRQRFAALFPEDAALIQGIGSLRG